VIQAEDSEFVGALSKGLKMAGSVFRITVPAACHGMRLDQYLAQAVPGFSRGMARKIIDLGGVHMDGRRLRRSSQVVGRGAALEIFVDGEPQDIFSIGEENILYQDSYLIAVNKPAGINTQPTPARYKGTLYEALIRHLDNPFRRGTRPSLGMVQRLDRDTSGVLVFSTHPGSHKPLSASFSNRSVRKIYLALVDGCLACEQGIFHSEIARQHRTNLMKSVDRGGKEALTQYSVVERFAEATLVRVEIPTGRSHQIRVHFSEAGHPLLGDIRYGGPANRCGQAVPRQMLHAWRIELEHPITKTPVVFEAPLPMDFLRWLECARHPESGPGGPDKQG
jgi:23S rRNA pseudouridine1911/1915/1917 synthase